MKVMLDNVDAIPVIGLLVEKKNNPGKANITPRIKHNPRARFLIRFSVSSFLLNSIMSSPSKVLGLSFSHERKDFLIGFTKPQTSWSQLVSGPLL